MSTQLHATWHTDSLDMVVLPSTSASRYNYCVDGGTSPENFGYHLVHMGHPLLDQLTNYWAKQWSAFTELSTVT